MNRRHRYRGRIYLGTADSNGRATVIVAEVENDESEESELTAAYREASEGAEPVSAKRDGTSDEAWNGLSE